jgi:hypothetical protein
MAESIPQRAERIARDQNVGPGQAYRVALAESRFDARRAEVADVVPETFSDRFLDVVLDKGLPWLLAGVGVLLAVVVGVQLWMWSS